MSSSLAGPQIEEAARTGRQRSGAGSKVAVYVMAVVLALVGGAATVMLVMQGPGGGESGAARPAGTGAPAVTATAQPTGPSVVPAPVPSATASATATTEPTAAPSATASSATSAAPSASGATGTKKWTPNRIKKPADPLDRR